MLRSLGAQVTAVGDGPSVEGLMGAGDTKLHFDLLVLDACLPDMDVIAFVHATASRQDERPAIVILATQTGRRALRERQPEAETWSIVDKPALTSELAEAISRALSSGPELEARREKKSAIVSADVRPLRVLLAEDTVANQRLIERTLSRRGHAVIVVDNGEDAVAAAEQGDYDVILMDVQMPKLGGLEAVAAIRSKPTENGRRVPIVALTAHAMRGDERRCLDAGMDAYMTKPIDVRKLVALIEDIARRGAAVPA
jgi:CheY-like chemotaxis protein